MVQRRLKFVPKPCGAAAIKAMARRSLKAFLASLAAARAGTVGFAGTYVSGGGGPPTTLDALGAWAAALGAPETTATARLPATSLVKPPRRLALLVAAPPKGSAGLERTTKLAPHADGFAALGAALRRPLAGDGRNIQVACAGGGDDARALCDDWREPLDTTGAVERFKGGGALRASIVDKGGSIDADGGVAFPKVGKVDGPLVAEVAALVEYAMQPGADRLDVLVASEASRVENAAAAAQLLKCACAAMSSEDDPAALVFVEPPSVNRRLAATGAPTASSTAYYSLEEIRNYQICLWTAIALISVLLSAVLFLACMRPEYDSLLYATFQANVGDHFGKEN